MNEENQKSDELDEILNVKKFQSINLLFEQLNEENLKSPYFVTSMFFSLVTSREKSFRFYKKEYVRKSLLTERIDSIEEFREFNIQVSRNRFQKGAIYRLNPSKESSIENGLKYHLRLCDMLNYINKSMFKDSDENDSSDFWYFRDYLAIKPESEALKVCQLIKIVDNNYYYLIFKLNYGQLVKFVTYCLEKLNQYSHRFADLLNLKNEINSKYSYLDESDSSAHSWRHSYSITNYNINERDEEFLIIGSCFYSYRKGEPTTNSDFYKIFKDELIQNITSYGNLKKLVEGLELKQLSNKEYNPQN